MQNPLKSSTDSDKPIVDRIIRLADDESDYAWAGQDYQLRRLKHAIENRAGKFAIFFAVCNNSRQQQVLGRKIASFNTGFPFEVYLTGSEDSLLDELLKCPGAPDPLIVYGIEFLLPSSDDSRRQKTLQELQLRREQFRKLDRPVLFWMPEYVYSLIGQRAVDFWSWQSGGFFFEDEPKNAKSITRSSALPLAATPASTYNRLEIVGRERQLSDLVQQLESGKSVLIQGTVGTGKTALAHALAQAVGKKYKDGQFFLSNLDQRKVSDALLEVIQAFEPVAKLPQEEAELIALYRSILADKKVLIVIDDANSFSEIRAFLPPTNSSLIVTSRHAIDLPGLVNARLESLSPDDARNLIFTIVPDIKPELADRLAGICDYLPLAIVIATKSLQSSGLISLERLQELENVGTPNAAGEIFPLFKTLHFAYQNLKPGARPVFRRLSVFRSSFTSEAARAVVSEPGHQSEIRSLMSRSLVDRDHSRYCMHPAIRDFADSLLAHDERQQAMENHARYYLRVLWNLDQRYKKGGSSAKKSLKSFDIEWSNIEAGQEWASENATALKSAAALAMNYPNAGAHILFIRRVPSEILPWLESALAAARKLGRQDMEQVHLGNLGNTLLAQGRIKASEEYFRKALELARTNQDKKNEMQSIGNLGTISLATGDTRRAIDLFEQALHLARSTGDKQEEIDNLLSLGDAYLRLGHPDRASESYGNAVGLAKINNDARREAMGLFAIGQVHFSRGDLRQARSAFEHCLQVARDLADRRFESQVMGALGRTYSALSEPRRALELFKVQLRLARELGDRNAESLALGNLGNAYRVLGDTARAADFLEQSLRIARQFENPIETTYALGNLANLYHRTGRTKDAIDLYEQALASSRQAADLDSEAKALDGLANAYSALGDYRRAIEIYEQELSISRRTGNQFQEATTLGNMGTAYASIGNMDRAIELYKADLEIAQRIGDRRGASTALTNIANSLAQVGHVSQAVKLYEQSLAFARQTGHRHSELNILSNLANAHATLKEHKKAFEEHNQALTLSREIGDRRVEATILYNLSQLVASQNRFSEAREYAEAAMKIFDSIKDPHTSEVQRFIQTVSAMHN